MLERIYYAHSMRIYGTEQERKELRFLRWRKFYRVINPNGRLSRESWKQQALAFIESSDALVFSEYHGFIGKGVYTEIDFAFQLQKGVYLLRDRTLYPIEKENVSIYNKDDWKVQYAHIAF